MSQCFARSFFLPFMPKPLNTMTIRYEFLITTPECSDGMRVAVDLEVINQLAARHKITRLYPSATKISFIRSHRIN
jgi:hypothetical protein